jgi:transposase-like protein
VKEARVLDPSTTQTADLPDKIKQGNLEIINEVSKKEEAKPYAGHDEPNPPCPHCCSSTVVKHGRTKLGMRYKCKDCNKTFSSTTGTVMYRSQSRKEKWIRAVRDTIGGVAIDKTAEALGVNHSTAFNMRHKILLAMESMDGSPPSIPSNFSEIDEMYVLKSLKGTRIPEDYHRTPRHHGSKAQMQDLASEKICIRTTIGPNGEPCAAVSIERATPSPNEADEAFKPHLEGSAPITGEGCKSVDHLAASTHGNDDDHLHDVDDAKQFHLFAKQYYESYGGLATKYLSRYANLFARIYRHRDWSDEEILRFLSDNQNFFNSVEDVKRKDLMLI